MTRKHILLFISNYHVVFFLEFFITFPTFSCYIFKALNLTYFIILKTNYNKIIKKINNNINKIILKNKFNNY